MSEKINNAESSSQQLPEFSPSFVKWLVILTVGTLLLIFTQNPSGDPNEYDNYREREISKYLLSPWLIAGGHTIESAIQEFSSGEGFQEVSRSTQYITLIGILIAFVIAPTLLFVGWRRFYELHASGKSAWSVIFRPMGILVIIGGAITVWIALSSIPVAYVQYNVYQSMSSSQNIMSNRDDLLSQVTSTIRAGEIYHTLPKSLGGGEWSYEGFSLSDTAMFPYGIIRISHVSHDSLCVEGISNVVPGASVVCALDSAGIMSMKHSGF